MSTLVETAPRTEFRVLGAVSFSHFLNDMLQSLIVAVYPLLKGDFNLSFTRIGLITLTYQCTASLLQPLVGMYTDKRPQPYSLVFGMGSTLIGLTLLAHADHFGAVLIAVAMVGMGSSVFHPESSRVARMASGGRHGLAQSVFQVGGNAGTAVGPLLAALIVLPLGRGSLEWFAPVALTAMLVLWRVGAWYSGRRRSATGFRTRTAPFPAGRTTRLVALLVLLLTSKNLYLASVTSYLIFYMIHQFGVDVGTAQLHLFVFLAAVAAGTVMGGPIGDRFGREWVIRASILGVAPFTLLLPHVGLTWTGILLVPIGFILASAFSAIVVYAQELMPNRVGTVSGLFFGLSFGIGGLGAAILGGLADSAGIDTVYAVCAWLPLIGLAAFRLPRIPVSSPAA